MSVRHTTAPPTPRTIDLPKDRLYHVLSVGASVSAEVELTDEDFEAAVHRYVEEVGTGMSVAARRDMTDRALRLAKQGTEYVKSRGKEAAKRTSKYIMKKSREAAKQLVNEVDRQRTGAYRPALWHELTTSKITKRICTDYRRHIEQEGWKKIKAAAANDPLYKTQVVYADTGANAHARIEITSKEVKVTIASSLESRIQEVSRTRPIEATISFEELKKITDDLVRAVVAQFREQLKEYVGGGPRS